MNKLLLEEVDLSETIPGQTDGHTTFWVRRNIEKQCGCQCRFMADEYHEVYLQRRETPEVIKKEMTKWLLMLLKGMAEVYRFRYALP